MVGKIQPVNSGGLINSPSARLKLERHRLGLSQVALGKALGVTKWTVINYEKTGGRGTPIPADLLAACARMGMDVQYIITGVASTNLNRVAEEAGSYKVESRSTSTLSKEEQGLLDKYRRLKPGQRNQARTIMNALVSGGEKPAGKKTARARRKR